MGSPCEVRLYSEQRRSAKRVANLVMADAQRIEARYSRYRSDSVLSEINSIAARGGDVLVDEETAGLLEYAHTCYLESDGLFDITSGILRRAWDFNSERIPKQSEFIPLLGKVGWDKVCWDNPSLGFSVAGMELDLGGVGKEYAVDRAATICLEEGIQHGLVNFGGDIRVIGPHPDGKPWSIGVKHPLRPDSLMASLDLYGGALASSGDYERCIEVGGKRYGHILNPKTGWPVQGLSAVTVVADQCLVAGSLSTVAMLKGDAGIRWLDGLGIKGIWMDDAGNLGGCIEDHRFTRPRRIGCAAGVFDD